MVFCRVCEALLYGVIIMSGTLVFAPTITTAFTGAHRLFKIIDRKPMIDAANIANKSRKADKCNNIKFKHIYFRYPTRPDVQVLNGFNLNIAEGKSVALVGPSGKMNFKLAHMFASNFKLSAICRLW